MFWTFFVFFSIINSVSCYYNAKYTESKYLLFEKFAGSWVFANESTTEDPFINVLRRSTVSQGVALIYYNNPHNNKNDDIIGVTISLLQPSYVDEQSLEIQIPFTDLISEGEIKWHGNSLSSINLHEKELKINSLETNLTYIITKEHISIGRGPEMLIWIRYQRENRSISFLIISLLCSIFLKLWIHKRFQNQVNTEFATKHSVYSIVFTLSLHHLLIWIFLIIGLKSLFNRLSFEVLYIIPAIFHFKTTRRVKTLANPILFGENSRPLLYISFSIIYQWILIFCRQSSIVYYIIGLSMIPEIYNAYKRGHKFKIDPSFFIYSGIPFIYMAYYKLSSNNIFRESPSSQHFFIAFGLFLSSMILLIIQAIKGPRFFIPLFLQPTRHEYYIKGSSDECPICLDCIKGRMMSPPCKHVFHVECLERWMMTSMTCPIDRSILPPL